MSSTSQLLGPPAIYKPPSHPVDDANVDNKNSQTGFTENNSLTYLSTNNPCLDFFFHIVPDTPTESLTKRLICAWDSNPLTTLKLICNLRGVRGTGKCDKENFYTSALWLHKNHPKTLACNVSVFAGFGYFKDLLEILYRILEGPDVRSKSKIEWERRKNGMGVSRKIHFDKKYYKEQDGKSKRKLRVKVPRERRVEANKSEVEREKQKARILRKERDFSKAKRAFDRYTRDPDYRFLHDQISTLFADLLKSDVDRLSSGEVKNITLAAKWCPTIDSSYDKATLIYESIARKVFPRENYMDYQGIEEAHYVYRVRDRLRKEVIVPLRKVLELPEVYMSANQWDVLPYNRVASVAMKNYKDIFTKHDGKRFEEYLEDVKHGKATMAAGALLPHEIIASLRDDDGTVAELQWARMVDDLSKLGKLRNCIAVCDVSGSMNGTPMEVCVALGLLISELSDSPWKGKVITFSSNPQLHEIKGDSLEDKTKFVRNMDWGSNTNFQRVFDRILQVAVDGKLSEDQMIKRIFVFSDMEFDQASGHYSSSSRSRSRSRSRSGSRSDSDSVTDTPPNLYSSDDDRSDSDRIRYPKYSRNAKGEKMRAKGWETDYEVIVRKFKEKGYNKVPEIVFWNLRNSSSTPVLAKQSGVAMVSGFSKNMVTLFLEEGGIVDPVAVMEKAIAGELYQKLVVLD